MAACRGLHVHMMGTYRLPRTFPSAAQGCLNPGLRTKGTSDSYQGLHFPWGTPLGHCPRPLLPTSTNGHFRKPGTTWVTAVWDLLRGSILNLEMMGPAVANAYSYGLPPSKNSLQELDTSIHLIIGLKVLKSRSGLASKQ